MGFHLYCVTRAELTVPDQLHGIGDAKVIAAVAEGVACWMTNHPERPAPSPDHAKSHHVVVAAAIQDEHTPIPLRFGQWLENEEKVVDVVRERAGSWLPKLDEIAGALEFGIRVVDPDTQAVQDVHHSTASTGREYMQALRKRVGAQDRMDETRTRLRAELAQLFGSLVRAEILDPLHTAHGVASVSHLVARSQFEAYQEALRELRVRMPTLRFLRSGPWPPYGFVA